MFTIASLIAILNRQDPKAELQTLNAKSTLAGVELSGRMESGEDFRIVAQPPVQGRPPKGGSAGRPAPSSKPASVK